MVCILALHVSAYRIADNHAYALTNREAEGFIFWCLDVRGCICGLACVPCGALLMLVAHRKVAMGAES